MIKTIVPGRYSGTIEIPASKSDAQRAILCAALSSGESTLQNIGESDDVIAMLKTIQKMGVLVEKIAANKLAIKPMNNHFPPVINVGESGLGVRLMTSVASLSPQLITINGEGSLIKRDLSFFDQTLPQMGVHIDSKNGKLPIQVKGPLKAGEYVVDGSESSQYISGLILALSQLDSPSKLTVQNLKSGPYVDMTLATMKAFGITVTKQNSIYQIPGGNKFQPVNYIVDGDWSAASYWLVAAALGKLVKVAGLSMKSLQADKSMLDALMQSGCRISIEDAFISVDGKNRRPLDFDATNCPDLFPALATYSALTTGTSIIKGVSRLANKESNRGEVLKEEFSKLGVEIELTGDLMIIKGKETVNGGEVSSHDDHRIAMCLAIAGIFADSEVIVNGAESVAKSYPSFWSDLESLS